MSPRGLQTNAESASLEGLAGGNPHSQRQMRVDVAVNLQDLSRILPPEADHTSSPSGSEATDAMAALPQWVGDRHEVRLLEARRPFPTETPGPPPLGKA